MSDEVRELAGLDVEMNEDVSSEERLYDDAVGLASDVVNNRTGLVRWLLEGDEGTRSEVLEVPDGIEIPGGVLLGPVTYSAQLRIRVVNKVLSWRGEIQERESAKRLRGEVHRLFEVIKGDGDQAAETDVESG